MSDQPSPNGGNGKRNANGRFAKGNPGGPGNPYARRVAQLRAMIADAVTDEDLLAIVGALVERAKEGDVVAARELFNRLVGRPPEAIDPDRKEMEKARVALRTRAVDAAEDRLFLS